MSKRSFTLIAAVAVAFILVGGNSTARATVTVAGQNGYTASLYTNPFDPNGDGVTVGADATTITSSPAAGLDHVVDRHDARSWTPAGGGRLQGNSTTTSGFMQFTAASSFTAGTLITAQAVGNFDGPMPYNAKLDGTTVQSGTGTINTHTYQVTALGNQSVSQLRIEYPSMPTFGGSPSAHYGDFNEAIILPKRMARISGTSTGTSTTFGTQAGVYDQDGTNGWVGNNGASTTITFTGGPQIVSALVLSEWENLGALDISIKNDANLAVAHLTVDTAADTSYGDIAVVRFDTPIETSSLRLDFTGTAGVREVIALAELPEPSAIGVMVLSAMAFVSGGRRRRTMAHAIA